MKFRKKPVVVEAIQWTGENIMAVMCFMAPTEPVHVGAQFSNADDLIGMWTNEGLMVADKGDWIIKEPFPTDDRRFYPCKPDIFDMTYEPVTEAGK